MRYSFHPEAKAELNDAMTRRFPFGVIYYERAGTIVILAVMQLNRKPGYWQKRKK